VKRLFFCVFLFGLAGACQGLDREHFERLETAGHDIEAAIDAKAGLPRYRELLDRFSAELASAQGRVQTSRDRKVLSQYEAAYRGLTDFAWSGRPRRLADRICCRSARIFLLASRASTTWASIRTSRRPSTPARPCRPSGPRRGASSQRPAGCSTDGRLSPTLERD
jgi:hypothetical protein